MEDWENRGGACEMHVVDDELLKDGDGGGGGCCWAAKSKSMVVQ